MTPKAAVLADLTSALWTLDGMDGPGSVEAAALVSGARGRVEAELAETAVPLGPIRDGVGSARDFLRARYLDGSGLDDPNLLHVIRRLNGVLDDLGDGDG